MLQYYLGIQNPGELSDEEWAMKWEALQFIRKNEKDLNATEILKALTVTQPRRKRR